MAQASPETIFLRKHTFLKRQVQILSQPLTPSREWNANANAAAGDDERRLSEKAVRDALFKANQIVAQHNKRVYAPEALHHIAEQLEGLYLGEEPGRGGDDAGDGNVAGDDGLRIGVDLTNPDAIAKLAPEWPSEEDVASHPGMAQEYSELVARLRELSAQRRATEARIARLRRLKEMLTPFNQSDQDMGGVQENLATRGGEVERELERQRLLLVRVAGLVAMPARDGQGDDDTDSLFREETGPTIADAERAEKQRVDEMLGRF